MKTITKIGTTLFLMLIMFSASAQNGSTKTDAEKAAMKEKMETLKVAYITEKVGLTEKEAKEFWPVYNQYKAELRSFRPEYKGDKKEMTDLSDAELKKIINDKFDVQQKKLDSEKAYSNKFIGIIGVQKVEKLNRAEHDFKKEMFDKIKSKHCSKEVGSS